VVLLIVEGNHVPEMPLVEVVGNVGAAVPAQIGLMVAKVGVIVEFTVTVTEPVPVQTAPP